MHMMLETSVSELLEKCSFKHAYEMSHLRERETEAEELIKNSQRLNDVIAWSLNYWVGVS